MAHILTSLAHTHPSNGQATAQMEAVSKRLGVAHVFGTGSGRTALWLALQSLHHLRPDRDVVAIPAYTCFSVAAAIVRAGLRIFPVEIDPRTLDFDARAMGELPAERLLCIVPCNLFGFPNDISAVQRAAKAARAYVVDDAAQALGSVRDGAFAGTRGDVGIYSLGRGKSLGSVTGGLLVTNSDEIADTIRSERTNLETVKAADTGKLLFKMASYSLFLPPQRFWIPNSLPFLKLGTTEFDPSFATQEMHPFSLALVGPLLQDLDRINDARRANAKAVRDGLQGSGSFEFPAPAEGSEATFVRLPVVARDGATRDRAITLLRAAGIGATGFYPSSICDIPDIAAHMSVQKFHRSCAEELSKRLLTLPVHPFVEPRDIERMVKVLAGF